MQKFYNSRFLRPLILIMISFFIYCVIIFTFLVIDVCCSVYFWRSSLIVHCFGVEMPCSYSLKSRLYVFFVGDCLKTWFIDLTKVFCLVLWLFLDIVTSLSFLNVVLMVYNKVRLIVIEHVMCGMIRRSCLTKIFVHYYYF